MPMTAFVTGGTGFLGRRLIDSLLRTDLRIRCLVREGSDIAGLLDRLPTNQQRRVELVRGDLCDRSFLEQQLNGIDIVYHLAAALGGTCSTLVLNTVIPTRVLLESAAAAQVGRFVLVSSLGVYGTHALRTGAALDETSPVDEHPELRDPYTLSKIRQEAVAWQAREQLGLPLVVVRPGVIYGPGRSLLTSRVGLSIGSFLLRMGGSQTLPYTYVDNCADAICQAGLVPGVDGEVFNVVDDDLPTGRKILKLLRRHGQRIRSIWIPRPAIGPLSALYAWYSDWSQGQLPAVLSRYKSAAIWKSLTYPNAKSRNKLNWQPAISTEEGLNRTITAGLSRI
jgi:nucleoside-diphosphate-sugar epimerase